MIVVVFLIIFLGGVSLMVNYYIGSGDFLLSFVLGSCDLTFVSDFYSNMFLIVSGYVTLSILKFSSWYMNEEPGLTKFISFLLAFFFFMILLVFSSNMVSLLVGWEGVGIMSFVLISWWTGRSEASSSGMQAFIYNRIGDFSIYLAIFFWVMSNSSLMFSYEFNTMGVMFSLAVLVGVMAKSSQVLFHPWLPQAMESPTPVSSLLHSSTMVVASVFLLIRLNHMVGAELVVVVSALTMLYSSVSALGQEDMKKIVAFSTTSQLGLMVYSLGMGFPLLAFFHMCMHAFFKSLIFISSSVFIHSVVSSTQDIRNGGLKGELAFVSLTISSLSLCSFPFMASFFSKEGILENIESGPLNRFSVLIIIISTILTTAYSVKLLLLVSSSGKGGMVSSTESGSVLWFMGRLVVMGMVSGLGMLLFSVVQETYLSGALKVVPPILFTTGVMLSMGSVLNKFKLFILNGSYNPILHRLSLTVVVDKFWKLNQTFEFFFWEKVYSSGLKGFASLVIPVAGGMVAKGLQIYFFISFLSISLMVVVLSATGGG